MRIRSVCLLLALAASAPASAQGVLRSGAGAVTIDSVRVWANLERGRAATFANYVFRNHADSAVDAAFFFPLPRDGEIVWTTVYEHNHVIAHGGHSAPDPSPRIVAGPGDDPGDALCRDGGCTLIHVPIERIPAHGVRQLQVYYTQPLVMREGAVRWAYPLTAGATPIGHVSLGLEITTEAGFHTLASPTHAVEVQIGQESGPCQPEERCGRRGYPSERVRVVRMHPGGDPRTRDFEMVYTPRPADRPVNLAPAAVCVPDAAARTTRCGPPRRLTRRRWCTWRSRSGPA